MKVISPFVENVIIKERMAQYKCESYIINLT